MTTPHELMTVDFELAAYPFSHDLVRSEDLELGYGVSRREAHRFLVGIGAVSLPRYSGGLVAIYARIDDRQRGRR